MLSGEAWKATEHLSVADIRSTNGWQMVKTLDHCRFSPRDRVEAKK